MVVGRALGGEQPVHASKPARSAARRRSPRDLRHHSRAEKRLPLVRLPGRVRVTHHGVQPLQQDVGSFIGSLASGASCRRHWPRRAGVAEAAALDGAYVKAHRCTPGGNATMMALSSTDSTVDMASFGPVGRSPTAVRPFHLATVF